MKDYFINLFNYDLFANQTLADTIISANSPGKAVQLMAHLLAAQQIWLNRCKGEPAISGALWPDWPADTFKQLIDDNHKVWMGYLYTLSADDFEQIIYYKNSKGTEYQNKLSDVLAHLINHGTHHRAQAGQQLKFAGVEQLPNTDYIFYIREIN